MSGLARGLSRVPTSTRTELTPASASRSRRYWYSVPLVSRVPTRTTVFSLIASPLSRGELPPYARRAMPCQHNRVREQLFSFFHHGGKVLTSLPVGCNVA